VQERSLAFLEQLNRRHLQRLPGQLDLQARIATYELAARMQTAATEALDLSRESKATQAMYGMHSANKSTADFGARCLLARRLVERGVRFVEIIDAVGACRDNWDAAHRDVGSHAKYAGRVDQPVAALITDLKLRGLLDETLLVFCTEFGRTPWAQDGKGTKSRNHHPQAFSCWLAGGGAKPGIVHGRTDDIGHLVEENVVHVHDLHATILHIMGLDHTRLTFRHDGRDFRLTDVHGRVVHELLA